MLKVQVSQCHIQQTDLFTEHSFEISRTGYYWTKHTKHPFSLSNIFAKTDMGTSLSVSYREKPVLLMPFAHSLWGLSSSL